MRIEAHLTDRLELALVYMLFVVPLGSCGSSSTRSSGLVTIIRYNQDISTTFPCALLGTGTVLILPLCDRCHSTQGGIKKFETFLTKGFKENKNIVQHVAL